MEEIKFDRVNDILLCPIESMDDEFLLRVFKESRPDLNLINGISEEQKEMLILEQFKMEKQQIMQIHPRSELNIVTLNEELVGRLYTNKDDTEYRILQIGILAQYRSLGIGSEIVAKVIENAIKEGKNVSLQVAWFNERACSFYKRLGFEIVKNNGVFFEMKYRS